MGAISAVLCWLGGVIVPTVSELAIPYLQARTNKNLDFWARIAIRDLMQDLMLGQLDARLFCERAVEIAGASIPADELEAAIKENAELDTSVLLLLAELPPTYQIWLISDYPHRWFDQIFIQLADYSFLHPDRVIFTQDLHIHRIIPDIYDRLVQKAQVSMDRCMMVDRDAARAVEAVKHGLSSEIYIDTSRLHREFVLRKMLP